MDTAEIVLRDYTGTDLEAMFLLDEICFAAEFRFDRNSMEAFASTRSAIVVIADRVAGPLAGFVILHRKRTAEGWYGYIVTLDVAPASRREGLAGRLMREVEVGASAAGMRWMELHVFTGNEGAIGFYERMGYVRVGVKPRFYGPTVGAARTANLDAFVYRKDLTGL